VSLALVEVGALLHAAFIFQSNRISLKADWDQQPFKRSWSDQHLGQRVLPSSDDLHQQSDRTRVSLELKMSNTPVVSTRQDWTDSEIFQCTV